MSYPYEGSAVRGIHFGPSCTLSPCLQQCAMWRRIAMEHAFQAHAFWPDVLCYSIGDCLTETVLWLCCYVSPP